eukprot:13801838-Heterocapsa_arctica.AAC.1
MGQEAEIRLPAGPALAHEFLREQSFHLTAHDTAEAMQERYRLLTLEDMYDHLVGALDAYQMNPDGLETEVD